MSIFTSALATSLADADVKERHECMSPLNVIPFLISVFTAVWLVSMIFGIM